MINQKHTHGVYKYKNSVGVSIFNIMPAPTRFLKASATGGGKLMAWFPHMAVEEDYSFNPLNSICSNEYV